MQSLLMTRAAVEADNFFLKFSLIWKEFCKNLSIYYPLKVSEALVKGILTILNLYSRMSEAVVFIFHEHLLASHISKSYATKDVSNENTSHFVWLQQAKANLIISCFVEVLLSFSWEM